MVNQARILGRALEPFRGCAGQGNFREARYDSRSRVCHRGSVDIGIPDLHRRGGFPLMAEKEKEKMRQIKKSSPCRSELGIIDFTATVKPKDVIKNIDQEPTDVKDGVESLFMIIGQAIPKDFPTRAQLQAAAAKIP